MKYLLSIILGTISFLLSKYVLEILLKNNETFSNIGFSEYLILGLSCVIAIIVISIVMGIKK